MAKQNINALEVLEQIQSQQSLLISQAEALRDSEIQLQLNDKTNTDLVQIFDRIAKQSTDFAQVLGEINEQIKR